MIQEFPKFSEFTMDLRPILHPLFQGLADGISDFTFANVYLFRSTHSHKISRIGENLFVICGKDGRKPFFTLPFGLPQKEVLARLFDKFSCAKVLPESQAEMLARMGYNIAEDRDNFDYLYLREDLVRLAGRKFHKKKNLVNAFLHNYNYEGKPLLEEYRDDALSILEEWRQSQDEPGDYLAAKQALEKMWELQLCGGIYYVDGKPAAYSLGEEIAQGKTFVVHFEKAIRGYKGLYQFVNQSFAAILPRKYKWVNREQDLGDEGLRHAKMSYNPAGFVKKYKATK